MLNADGFVAGEPGSDDGSMTLSWWQRLAPSGAILMQEFWQQSPSTLQMRVSGSSYDQQWDGWQRLPAWCLQAGVQFVGLTWGTSDQVEYARVSALLANPNALQIRATSGSEDPAGNWMRTPGTMTIDHITGIASLG